MNENGDNMDLKGIDDQTNLIINYLPQDFTDEEFIALFERIGQVKSGRIIRNKHTNYSYGFGFIQYWKKEDALSAIDRLNGYQLKHKRIKVAFSRPQNSNIKQAKLYIKNVPPNFTEEQLMSVFAKYGKIIQCRLLGDGESKAKGIAFILYDLHEQAEKALEQMNGVQLNGAVFPLEIKYATDGKDRGWKAPSSSNGGNGGSSSGYRNSYANYTNDAFNYSSYFDNGLMGGPIRNIQNSKSYYRYNPFSNQAYHDSTRTTVANSAATAAATSSNNLYHQQQQQQQQQQQPRGDASDYVLFVYNIGPQTDEDTLCSLFSKFGHVIKSQVIRKNNESRGFGFVTMATYEDAVNAIHSLNGFVFRGKSLQVNFKQ